MKQKACRLIDHTMSNLDLHEIVGSRAKKMFAEFRDVREHVHQFDAMVAGCVIAAYMETSKEMYSAQNGIRIGQHRQAGIASLALPPNKAVDEKKLHPFMCLLCDMKFNARRGMQFHKCAGKSEEDKEKTLRANLSPVVLPELLQPIIEMKNGKQWFKCPVCSRAYGKEESLTEHMVRHNNQIKKRKHHIETSMIDSTRLAKTTKLASANRRRPALRRLVRHCENNLVSASPVLTSNGTPVILPGARDRAPPTRGKGTLPPVWSEVACACTFFQPGFSGVQAIHERRSQ